MMKPVLTHKFNVDIKSAMALQSELKSRIEEKVLDLRRVRLIAGADASYSKGEERMFAAVAVFSFPDLELLEERTCSLRINFPYVPGLLAFREAPALISAFEKVRRKPDVVLFDGHGISHPRGFGIASHMGVLLGVPSIGVAKSVLVGEWRMPAEAKGSVTPIKYDGKIVGIALRTRSGKKPIFVSVGNLINLESAVKIVLACCTRYRLPEPIRATHGLSNEARRRASSG